VSLKRLIDIAALSALLSACASPQPQLATPTRQQDAKVRQQLKLQLASGAYRCELDQRIDVQRDAVNANLIELAWQGRRHTLQRYDSTSGLPRYEDREKGLLWIDLPWKSVLMDINSGRPLANDCRAMPG
jgi:hypothetical protein